MENGTCTKLFYYFKVRLIVSISHVIKFLKLFQSILHASNLQISFAEYQQSIYQMYQQPANLVVVPHWKLLCKTHQLFQKSIGGINVQPDGEHVHLNVRIEPANKTCKQIMQRTGSYRSEPKHVHILNYNFFFF